MTAIPAAFCPSPCSRRMDMCTEGCICTLPGVWRSQTGIASLSRCLTRPSLSLWCGFWFFPMSQPRVSNFLSDSPTAKLISSGVRFTSKTAFITHPFKIMEVFLQSFPGLCVRRFVGDVRILFVPEHWLAKWQMFSESWILTWSTRNTLTREFSSCRDTSSRSRVCSGNTACDCPRRFSQYRYCIWDSPRQE